MKRSTDRVVTTHAGSLLRPEDVFEVLRAGGSGEQFEARVRVAVVEIIRQRVEHRLDVIDAGALRARRRVRSG